MDKFQNKVEPISLSITNTIQHSLTQSVQGFPVTRRFQYLNGVVKNLENITITGIVTDDTAWGDFVDFAMTNIPDIPNKQAFKRLKKRNLIANTLKGFYNNETILVIEDTQLGVLEDLIITSLVEKNSEEFENATEWEITFTKIPVMRNVGAFGEIGTPNTIDPYSYYNYLSTKVRPEGIEQ